MSDALSRPLPPVTDETEFFWRSGADGTLRFQECTACNALIHPPQPVCRYCRSREMGVREVSGRATLFGFTVNHRFSLPGLPAAVRRRAGRDRRGPAGAADHQHRRVRSRAPRARPCGGGRLRTARRRLAAAVPAVPRRSGAPTPRRPSTRSRRSEFGEHVRPMLTTEKFEDKVALTGHRHVRDRPPADAAAAVADRRGVRARDRRRRPDVRRHRRAVHLPGRRRFRAVQRRAA